MAAGRRVGVDQRVLLFNAKPRIEVLQFRALSGTRLARKGQTANLDHFGHRFQAGATSVGSGRLLLVGDRLAENQLVVASAERVVVQSDRQQIHVRVAAFGLSLSVQRLRNVSETGNTGNGCTRGDNSPVELPS